MDLGKDLNNQHKRNKIDRASAREEKRRMTQQLKNLRHLNKYISIGEVPSYLYLYNIQNRKSGDNIAMIYINPLNDIFVFNPLQETIWNSQCLKDVEKELDKLEDVEIRYDLYFDRIKSNTKTSKWLVRKEGSNGKNGIGRIKYYPAWRQYCFFVIKSPTFAFDDARLRFSKEEVGIIRKKINSLNEGRKMRLKR